MPGNGCVEGFDGELRDEPLDREVFSTPREAQVLIERWRRPHNPVPPRASLGFRPPAREVVVRGVTGPPGRPGPPGSAQPPAAMLHGNGARTTRWGLVPGARPDHPP